jgi:hypothetical protein
LFLSILFRSFPNRWKLGGHTRRWEKKLGRALGSFFTILNMSWCSWWWLTGIYMYQNIKIIYFMCSLYYVYNLVKKLSTNCELLSVGLMFFILVASILVIVNLNSSELKCLWNPLWSSWLKIIVLDWVCPPLPNLYVEILTPSILVLESGTCGRF